jgi:hypothetical protein
MKMFKSRHFFTLAVTILLVLFASAAWTVPVFADDETPPPTETPLETQPVEETPPPAETPAETFPADETAPVETPAEPALPAEETANESVTPETAPAEEAVVDSAAELLASVPEGTEVVVVDENGEAVPLATEEAAEAVVLGDPIWCPATTLTPVNGGAGCTTSFTSFQALIDHLIANPKSVNGVIWVEKSFDSSVGDPGDFVFTLNGDTDFAGMSNFALTIKGGWNGLGTGTVNTTDPSEFNGLLEIINWHNDVTISDILITDVGGPALNVITTGKVTLTRVKVNDNPVGGGSYAASINNSTGTGTVTITLSEFANNTGHGLRVISKGLVTITDILAASNDGNGAEITNTDSTTAAGVTMLGTNVFSDNFLGGLLVDSKGAIKINNLIANVNHGGAGADLDNHTAATAQPITLTGASEFKLNDLGLMINSNGAVALTNITANNNTAGNGVTIHNDFNPSLAPNVLMTGANIFYDNFKTGLEIWSYGMVTLSGVKANSNGLLGNNGYGAYINNSAASAAKSVTLNKAPEFNNNYSGGLNILSKGAVTITTVTANSNVNGPGVRVDNQAAGTTVPQNVVINVTSGTFNNFNANGGSGGDGVYVTSYGAITLTNVNANDNGGYGARLDNCDLDTTPDPDVCKATLVRSIALTGTNTFNGNGSSGLDILSRGAVSISYLRASENSGFGANIDNAHPATLLVPQSVTLSGNSILNGNDLSGLVINTYGIVTLYSITANENGQAGVGGSEDGVFIDNEQGDATLAKTVTLNGVNTFSGNRESGLVVSSLGTITVNNVTANNNVGGWGVNLRNDNGSSTGSISVKGTNNFSGNGENGLFIGSQGTISVNSVTAVGNGLDGAPDIWEASITNSAASTAKAISLTGTNTFSGRHGLYIESKGAITTYNINASGNYQGFGASLKNTVGGASAPQNITLYGVNIFNDNFLSGLRIETYGTVTLYNVTANGNGGGSEGYGIYVNNLNPGGLGAATLVRGVTFKGAATTNANAQDGLHVESLGTITMAGLTSNGNTGSGANGAYLISNGGGLTLSGVYFFSNNNSDGLYFDVLGAVTMTKVTADNNGGDGIDGDSDNNITLTCGSTNSNGEFGWNFNVSSTSVRTVTLKGVFAFANNSGGVQSNLTWTNVQPTLTIVRNCP